MSAWRSTVAKRDWLDTTVVGAPTTPGRHQYKSTYMKRSFSRAEAACIYKHLNRVVPGLDLSRATVLVDSFGGAANRREMLEETSVSQRSSVAKMQFITSWTDAADDAGNARWLREFYTELYSGPDANPARKGTPYPNDHYEGCYINYPDVDMLGYQYWPQLYYGDEGLYPSLQDVKKRYDPNNVFHHSMAVRLRS